MNNMTGDEFDLELVKRVVESIKSKGVYCESEGTIIRCTDPDLLNDTYMRLGMEMVLESYTED